MRQFSLFWVPAVAELGRIVVISAVVCSSSMAQAALAATQPLFVAQATDRAASTVLMVNPALGNDQTADGSDRAPFRTITKALQAANPNTVVVLAAGTYSVETGETFPIQLKSGVTIQGNPQTRGQEVVIKGTGSFLSPSFARQNITLLGANQAALIGVTVSNPDPQGYGLWIESSSPVVTDSTFTGSGHDGISAVGKSAPLVRNNYFYQNGANGITIYGTSRPEVRDNIFENTGFAININQKAAPLIVGNRITQNKDGIVVQAFAQPILRNNSVEGNERDGLVAIAQSRPDLGTAAEPGGNLFRNNGQFDLNCQATRQVIPAHGNEMLKLTGQVDVEGTSPSIAAAPALTSDRPAPPPSRPAVASIPVVPASAPKSSAVNDISAASFPIPTIFQAPLGGSRPTASQAAVLPPPKVSPAPVSVYQPTARPQPVPPPVAVRAQPNSAAPTWITIPSVPPQIQAASAPVRPMNLPIPSSGSRPAASSTETGIAIPVPPPEVRPIARSLPAQLTAPIETAIRVAPAQETAIPIPVPPPESRSVTPTPPRPESTPIATFQVSPVQAAGGKSPELLPVPGPDAPIGDVGEMPEVSVYRNPRQRSAANPPAPPARSMAMNLRYRVVVEAGNESQQAQVQAIVPAAFRTFSHGRMVMQLGAFGERAKADELVRSLAGQGIRASVEQLE